MLTKAFKSELYQRVVEHQQAWPAYGRAKEFRGAVWLVQGVNPEIYGNKVEIMYLRGENENILVLQGLDQWRPLDDFSWAGQAEYIACRPNGYPLRVENKPWLSMREFCMIVGVSPSYVYKLLAERLISDRLAKKFSINSRGRWMFSRDVAENEGLVLIGGNQHEN